MLIRVFLPINMSTHPQSHSEGIVGQLNDPLGRLLFSIGILVFNRKALFDNRQ